MTDGSIVEAKNKQLTHILYALYALSIFTGGLAAIVAVIINYVKASDVAGTWIDSHFRWQIRTFWWGLLWAIVGVVTAIVGVGFIILLIEAIWIVYRVVRGWLYLNDNKPMYNKPTLSASVVT